MISEALSAAESVSGMTGKSVWIACMMGISAIQSTHILNTTWGRKKEYSDCAFLMR